MKRRIRLVSLLLTLCVLSTVMPIGAITAFASGGSKGEDAMTEIENELSAYKIGETQSLTNDGYIGIPIEMSVYFDKENHTAVTGYNGTPLIIYVVNTMIGRIGTDSDAKIIGDMLKKGYIVYVLDYLNSSQAVSQELDFSVQILRKSIEQGKYIPDTTVLPSGSYYENFVVPAGYTVSLGHVFFEIDKHAADGTLEKIVEIWNNDFKTVKGESLVKWVRENGDRKTAADARTHLGKIEFTVPYCPGIVEQYMEGFLYEGMKDKKFMQTVKAIAERLV